MKARCPKCKSQRTTKYGFRPVWDKGGKTMKQAYVCQNCGHQWREK